MQRSTDRARSTPLSASGELAETSEHLRELLRSFRKKFFATRKPRRTEDKEEEDKEEDK